MPHSRSGGEAWYDLGQKRFDQMHPDDGSKKTGNPFILSTPVFEHSRPIWPREDDKYIYFPGEAINKKTGELELRPGPHW